MQNIAIPYTFTMTIFCYICYYTVFQFCWYNIHNRYNFITGDNWSISHTLYILAILTNTYTRIATTIFFPLVIIFTFTLTCVIIPFLIWFDVALLNLHLQLHQICFVIALASFLFIIVLNASTFLSFFFFWNTYFWP